jgi:hypothetical protein
MNNVIMRQIEVTTEFAPLVPERMVGTFEISTPPTNSGNVIFKGDDGSEVAWIPSEFHELRRVNLAEIYVKGQAGDIVSVVGGTW